MLFGAHRPLLIAAIKLFKALCLFAARLQGFLYRTWPFLLADGMSACTFRGRRAAKIAAPSAQALVRGNNLQRAIQHVAAGLHNDLVFRAMPPSAITLLTAIP